jgi:hypothetical protein
MGDDYALIKNIHTLSYDLCILVNICCASHVCTYVDDAYTHVYEL